MANASINDLGNGSGYLYITEKDGTTLIRTGIINDNEGVDEVKKDALNRAPVGTNTTPEATLTFSAIPSNWNIDDITVAGISILDNTVPITALQEEQAAIDVATEINSSTPVSGVNYTAVAVGEVVHITPSTPVGSSLNGSATNVIQSGAGTPPTLTVTNLDGGQDGTGVYSEINGHRYFLDADYGATGCSGAGTADPVSLVNAIEISEFVIMRGTQSAIPKQDVTINGDGNITSTSRVTGYGYIEILGAAAVDLNNISSTDFSIGDIITVYGKDFNTTFKDLTLVTGGNIKLASEEDFVTGSTDEIIMLTLVSDSVYGDVWTEISRNVMAIADLAVSTAKIKDLSVTTAKMALSSVDGTILANDTVVTAKILDLAVTTAKMALLSVDSTILANLAVTTAKLALLSVDDTILAANSVISSKIADANVLVAKLEETLLTELIVVPISWDANRIGDHKIVMPFACDVKLIDIYNDDLIEVTDDADVEAKDDGGLSMGTATFAAGTTIGTGQTITPTANNSFIKGGVMTLTTTKATAGGNAKVSIEALRT